MCLGDYIKIKKWRLKLMSSGLSLFKSYTDQFTWCYTYFGFGRGSGSSRPFPAGFFSASSSVSNSNSASSFPYSSWLERLVIFSYVSIILCASCCSSVVVAVVCTLLLLLLWAIVLAVCRCCDVVKGCEKELTASSISSRSVLTVNGHHPLMCFSLNKEIWGTVPSFLAISRVQVFTDLEPLGIRFKSNARSPGGEICHQATICWEWISDNFIGTYQ